jgi:hypothetical protein
MAMGHLLTGGGSEDRRFTLLISLVPIRRFLPRSIYHIAGPGLTRSRLLIVKCDFLSLECHDARRLFELLGLP